MKGVLSTVLMLVVLYFLFSAVALVAFWLFDFFVEYLLLPIVGFLILARIFSGSRSTR